MMLDSSFFERPTDTVARGLLGKYLCFKRNETVERHMITETEAYLDETDLASHARFGRTGRSSIMYHAAGTIYSYLIYGMYDMLNIVTEPEGQPGAVLIRGVEGFSGPGKLTKGLGIARALNGQPLGTESGLWIEEGITIPDDSILVTPRIGIDYAGPIWKEALLRFILKP